ncbi:hypothetical protein [Synechococcus sp. PCC 7336]|uniref:hypothetical protein n=1 Tax=Synechococcus sp. PCC 7336 TaxID=195250 RepID=UPI00036D8C23|nr:hypothetical protein [Synechococcus sp. PCC 7336]
MTIETVVHQVLASGVFLERHRKAVLILLEAGKCTNKDMAAIVRLQAAVNRGEIQNLCFTQPYESSKVRDKDWNIKTSRTSAENSGQSQARAS